MVNGEAAPIGEQREEIDLGQCSVWEFSHHETIAVEQDGAPKGETRK
jgi:hypothetical protein